MLLSGVSSEAKDLAIERAAFKDGLKTWESTRNTGWLDATLGFGTPYGGTTGFRASAALWGIEFSYGWGILPPFGPPTDYCPNCATPAYKERAFGSAYTFRYTPYAGRFGRRLFLLPHAEVSRGVDVAHPVFNGYLGFEDGERRRGTTFAVGSSISSYGVAKGPPILLDTSFGLFFPGRAAPIDYAKVSYTFNIGVVWRGWILGGFRS